jgi:hypothetical protein
MAKPGSASAASMWRAARCGSRGRVDGGTIGAGRLGLVGGEREAARNLLHGSFLRVRAFAPV